MKRRIGPLRHTFYIAVLHRVEMNVIRMPAKIIFVANLVLPESPLPDRGFAVLAF